MLLQQNTQDSAGSIMVICDEYSGHGRLPPETPMDVSAAIRADSIGDFL
jgi:hypothetical protein